MARPLPVEPKAMSQHADQLIVRPAREEDVPPLARLTGQLGYTTSETEMRSRLTAMAADPDRVTLVAERQGAVVGYVGMWIGQGYETDAPHARVMALAVAESERRRGIGSALMRVAEDWSRARGAGVIVLNSRGSPRRRSQLLRAARVREHRSALPQAAMTAV